MPNLARAPRYANSSVVIWPVLRKATDSGPCRPCSPLNRSVNTRSALSQLTGRSRPRGVPEQRGEGSVGASRWPRNWKPFGQALPWLTG